MLTVVLLLLSGCGAVKSAPYEVRSRPYGSCVTAAPRNSDVTVGTLIVGPGDPTDESVRASWGRALRTQDAQPFTVEVFEDGETRAYEAERGRNARVTATFEEKRSCEERSRALAADWRVEQRALRPQQEAQALQAVRQSALAQHTSDWSTARIETAFIEREDGPEIFARRAIAGPDAPVVIVVNDGPGKSHDHFQVQEVLADSGWTVVLYDQRGVGLSASPTDDDYSLHAQAVDLDAVRQWSGAQQVAVLGYDWGGPVAFDYAARYPDNVLGVLVVGSQAIRHQQWGRQDPALVYTHTTTQIARMRRRMAPSCQPWVREVGHEYANITKFRPHHMAGTCHSDVLALVTEDLEGFDLRPAMQALTVPVLVWYGDGDASRVHRSFIVDALPQAQVVEHLEPACGHRPVFQCPDRLYDVLIPFMDSVTE